MNILLSAYSINPYKGSEDAVGWNWALTLSRKLPDSTIYILTRTYNEIATKKGIKEYGLQNVKLVIVEVPKALDWFREKHSAFHHAYYILWQKVAYNWAKKSGIKFDIIHHVSMGNYRICGDMYKFKDAHTIFGPVGGGQTTPASLRSYYNKNKNYEKFRDIVSKAFSKFNFYKKQLSSFIPFHVSLYGKGELENEIKQYIKKYKLENTVAVKGNIDYSQVIGVYQNADIFVHPTLRDSAGTVFIEAIANKLPIVALDQSFAHDLSEHECGLFVNTEQSKEEIINEFAGKLKELIENYDLRVKLGQNGYDYANTYLTMDYKFDTIYGKLIK